MNKEDKISQIRGLLIKELDLVNILDKDDFLNFLNKFTIFLRQDRNNTLISDEKDVIKNKINNFNIFCNNIGLSNNEKLEVLYNNFRMLDVIYDEDFLKKYVILSAIENENNTVRKEILKKESRVFHKSIDELFGRYSVIKESGIPFSKNLLISGSFKTFINHFTRKSYLKKPHELFTSEISLDALIKKYPVDNQVIDELLENDLNKNVTISNSNNSFLTKMEKIELAIKNYKKAKNLNELCNMLGISTSSLQRYLHDDAKKIVSASEYNNIKNWLQNAKIMGYKLGGNTSQKMHGYKKDDMGSFKGSGKK